MHWVVGTSKGGLQVLLSQNSSLPPCHLATGAGSSFALCSSFMAVHCLAPTGVKSSSGFSTAYTAGGGKAGPYIAVGIAPSPCQAGVTWVTGMSRVDTSS